MNAWFAASQTCVHIARLVHHLPVPCMAVWPFQQGMCMLASSAGEFRFARQASAWIFLPHTCMDPKAADTGGTSAGQAPMRSRIEALAGVIVLTRALGG